MLIQRISQNYMPIDAPEIDHDVVVVPLHKTKAVGLAFGQGRTASDEEQQWELSAR